MHYSFNIHLLVIWGLVHIKIKSLPAPMTTGVLLMRNRIHLYQQIPPHNIWYKRFSVQQKRYSQYNNTKTIKKKRHCIWCSSNGASTVGLPTSTLCKIHASITNSAFTGIFIAFGCWLFWEWFTKLFTASMCYYLLTLIVPCYFGILWRIYHFDLVRYSSLFNFLAFIKKMMGKKLTFDP